jgi:acetyl/propionyl-CoA carboxylase alpha subunit
MIFSYRYNGEDDNPIEVQVSPLDEAAIRYRITVGKEVFDLSAHLFYRAAFVNIGGDICLQYEGKEYHLSEAGQRRRTAPGQSGDLRAPMAGKIIQVLVQPGDTVAAGDPLLILEAMKMEQQIAAPKDGVVDRILCEENEQVAAGAELVVLRDTPHD